MSAFKTFVKKIRRKKKKKKEIKKLNEFRNSLASCGENLLLFGTPEISEKKKLSIGDNCRINSCVYINSRSGVVIGDDVTFSHGAKVISTGYDIEKWINDGKKIHTTDTSVYIGNHCWIGTNAVILPGVKITGEYVVIGAGAVVTKDIAESKVLVAGVPAKIVKHF